LATGKRKAARRAPRLIGTGVVALIAGVLGCSVEPVGVTADADTGTTHALVTVERSAAAGAQDSGRANALVGFVHVPPTVDPASVLQLVGLGLELPPAGQCTLRSRHPEGTGSLGALGALEFLAAGDVALSAGHTETRLAPRALPTVTDLVSGVVYTTRDRSADPLPPGAIYQVRASGGSEIPPLFVQTDAPSSLEGLTIGGAQPAELGALSTSRPIDLVWTPGGAGDVIYVELATDAGESAVVCSFRDEAGVGTVTPGAFSGTGAGYVAVHRLRTHDFTRQAGGLAHGELRFDFELVAPTSFVD